MTTENESFIPVSEFLTEDDIYAVKLPAQSKFPGCWLVYSISSRGSWIAAAIIIRGDLTEDDLWAINPFEDENEIQNAIQELNLVVVDKLEPVEGDMYDPVMFTLDPSQTYIDWWSDNDEDCLQGVYFGTDPDAYVYDYFDQIGFNPENGEYEDDDADYDSDNDF